MVRFAALNTLTVMADIFWNVMPWSLVEVYLYFRVSSCIHYEGSYTVRVDNGTTIIYGR